MTTPFTLLLRVRYGECDSQQVVFNPRYADYVDIAVTEFYRYALGGYQSLVDRSLESQVVKLDIQWQSSARFDDVLKLQVETTHIGTTSYTLKVDISHQDHGQKIAVAEVVYVLVDAEEFKKLPIPDDIRQQLLIGAPDIKVNQAG